MRNELNKRMAAAPLAEPTANEIKALVALHAQGRLQEMLQKAGGLAKKYPTATIVRNLLGVANTSLGRTEQAIACFSKAIELDPNFAESHSNLGLAYWNAGRFGDAIASYQNAIQIKPHLAEAHINLCELLNRLNETAELERALQTAARNGLAAHPLFLLLSAKLEYRKGDFEEVGTLLNCIDPDNLPTNSRRDYYHYLGLSCDRMGMYHEAFENFEKQNQIATNAKPQLAVRAQEYLKKTAELAQLWKTESKPNWSDTVESEDVSLAFLIGFPRSGTTLLDTILLGHPKTAVVEERPTVARMREQFGRIASIEELNKLTDSEIKNLRKVYFKELANHVDRSTDPRLIIDKHPMNIRNVGLIRRVFPQAKFILALRHPCDCVLSCFMQNFILLEATYNFLTIEGSAKLYAEVMDLWKAYINKLNIDVFTVKYEELILDAKKTGQDLVAFLGLHWDENLLDHQATARRRGQIETPSYNQVVEPIYTRSSGRWRNYHDRIEPVLPVLEPWIREFGYDS